MRLKKTGWLLLCILALLLCVPAATAERVIPDALKVTQKVNCYRAKGYRIITWAELHTVNEEVNNAINGRVEALKEEALALVPKGTDHNKRAAHADIYTQITRTGDRWLSFHVCAHTSVKGNQTWVKCEEYTYDMESGRLIRLGDIITEEGWEKLLSEIRTQLQESFPEEDPEEDALNAVCSRYWHPGPSADGICRMRYVRSAEPSLKKADSIYLSRHSWDLPATRNRISI